MTRRRDELIQATPRLPGGNTRRRQGSEQLHQRWRTPATGGEDCLRSAVLRSATMLALAPLLAHQAVAAPPLLPDWPPPFRYGIAKQEVRAAHPELFRADGYPRYDEIDVDVGGETLKLSPQFQGQAPGSRLYGISLRSFEADVPEADCRARADRVVAGLRTIYGPPGQDYQAALVSLPGWGGGPGGSPGFRAEWRFRNGMAALVVGTRRNRPYCTISFSAELLRAYPEVYRP